MPEEGGRSKFQEHRMTIIQINKIGSINGFKSWLLAISWLVGMCSISSNSPWETPVSASRCSVLPRYLSILQNFFKKYSFQHFFFEEVVIIIKFLIEIYKETTPLR